jgi:hypothetical protein
MAFNTKINLDFEKVYQSSGDTLQLSGSTILTGINGKLSYASDVSQFYTSRSVPDVGYVQNESRKQIAAGVKSYPIPEFVDNGDGTGTVTGMTVYLYDNANFEGNLYEFSVDGDTFSFIDGSEEYVCISYNGGSPIMYKETSESLINCSNIIRLYNVWRQGTTLHSLSFDNLGIGLSNKIQSSIYNTNPYIIDYNGGLSLGETNTPSARTITITSGNVYTGAIKNNISEFNSSTDLLTLYYHVGGSGIYLDQNTYDNEYYDNGTNLVSISNNKYGVRWFYRSIGDVKQCFYVLGNNEYNSIEAAKLETMPTNISNLIKRHCILIGRIIIQRDAVSGVVENVSTTSFRSSIVTNHNDLNNIQLVSSGVTYGHINDDSQSIYGVKTFNSFPITPLTAPTTDYQVANRKFVIDQVTGNTTPHSGLTNVQGGGGVNAQYHSDQPINSNNTPTFNDVYISGLSRNFTTLGEDTKLDTGIPFSERSKFKVNIIYSGGSITSTVLFTSGNTSFSYYIKGKKFIVTSSEINSYTINETASEGTWFFYIDHSTTDVSSPNLVLTKTPWTITDPDVLLWNFYFNATNNTITWIAEERHTAGRDIFNHARDHSQGALYRNGFLLNHYNGLSAANIATNTNNNFGRASVVISGGSFFDEDILNNIAHSDSSINSTVDNPYTNWSLIVNQYLGFTDINISTTAGTIAFASPHTFVTGQAITVMQGNTQTIRGTFTINVGGTSTSFAVTTVTGSNAFANGDAVVVGARIPIYYVSSVAGDSYTWRKLSTSDFLGVSGGAAITTANIATAVPQYNNATSGGFSNLSSVRYYPIYLLATNFISEPIIAVLGQGQSTNNNLTTALSETPFQFQNLVGLSNLGIQEEVPFYRLTYRYDSGPGENQNRIRLVDATFINVRVATVSGSVLGSATSHNQLPGLELANTGVTYGHITDQAQDIYGIKDFKSGIKINGSETLTEVATGTTNNNQLATKGYVDDNSIGDAIPYSGATTNVDLGTNDLFANNVYSAGINWTSRTTPVNNQWYSVCYGNGLFVAVSADGTNNSVMTSPDGINWTSRTTPVNNQWRSVCYGNGLFVAVSYSGTNNRVMTSPDGINWTIRTTPVDNSWISVCYGNGLFVAVSYTGTNNRVMTSPDGINWTSRTTPVDNYWTSICYGNGLFVAVSADGTNNRVMTSSDGINWTSRTTPANNSWYSICYGNGLFVAISSNGTNNSVMTSPDGINWTIRTTPTSNVWNSVCYGNGLFVAVSANGTNNQVMTSTDGINWTSRTTPVNYTWYSVCYGNGLFVAVSANGTNNRVMTSGKQKINELQHNNIYQGGLSVRGVLEISGEAKLTSATNMGSSDSSLATKKYVDDLVSGSTTGTTSINHNDTLNIQLANSGVTYGHIDNTNQSIYGIKDFKSGIKINGSETVTEVATGTTDNDKLATQGYVDDNAGSGGSVTEGFVIAMAIALG